MSTFQVSLKDRVFSSNRQLNNQYFFDVETNNTAMQIRAPNDVSFVIT